MEQSGALRSRNLARTATLSALGIVILAVAVFAILNVHVLDQWGAKLGGVFAGSKPVPVPVAILLVFMAGVVTSLTPCVYPVIPLAVTYLGARGATSRVRAFSLAAAYVAGMVICYTALGAAAALTGTTFGTATQKWWIYAGVATLILFFGLSMLGVFNLQLPSWVMALASSRKGPGYRGAFLMGTTSGLVTAPCTAPVLGALLPIIARQSVMLGSFLLAVFGLGMGMLFLVVGTYSGVLASLPRSGKWMNWVKLGLGTAILLVAGYFYYQAWLKLPIGGARAHELGPSAAGRQIALSSPAAGDPGSTPVRGSRGAGLDVRGAGLPGASPSRVLLALARGPDGEPGRPPEGARQAAPEFALTDVRGRPHDLASYRGKTLHLVFFAIWCPPCIEQMKRIEIADARLRGRGYRVLIVALKDREDEEAVRTFAERRQIGFSLAWDRSGQVASAYGVDAIPAHVIIGPNGTILYQGRDLPDGFEKDGAGLFSP